MNDSDFNQSTPRSQPQSGSSRGSAPTAPQRPASSGFDDMDDDIPF
jgi:single-strand DNA-binding protein